MPPNCDLSKEAELEASWVRSGLARQLIAALISICQIDEVNSGFVFEIEAHYLFTFHEFTRFFKTQA